MRWVKASERMPTAADAVDGDVVVRWVHNCGTHCIAVVNVMDVNGHDEWLEGAFADIRSPNGRGNHSTGPDYSTLGGNDGLETCDGWQTMQKKKTPQKTLFFDEPESVGSKFNEKYRSVLLEGNSEKTLKTIPDGSIKLIITSPPYNIGKAYEKATDLEAYLSNLDPILEQLHRVLHENGSLCWQVGNYVENSEVFPLDLFYYPIFKKLGLKLRNRIVWYFDHGLHASKRFSGRYEVMLWFTKGDDFTFNLDSVRVPSKYPGKRNYKPGENYGKPSGNPLGKNPSDIWKLIEHEWESGLWCIPNVKANHPEKTIHPCQFPIELVERCVLALTNEDDWVLDPFSGVGSAILAALKNGRRGVGCEKEAEYIQIAKERIEDFRCGRLRYRQLGKPVHQPTGREKVSQVPHEWLGEKGKE